jgi:hypothetical protein
MHVETDHDRGDITFAQMKAFLQTGWGKTGLAVADAWLLFNKRYFGGKLQPIPIVLTATSPYGHWSGLTTCNARRPRAHLIEMTAPRMSGNALRADRGVLLHEMIHQHLTESGRWPKHDGEAWCEEIMRLHFAITGKTIWAAPEKIGKQKDDDGKRKSVRKQAADPIDGRPSISQAAIASWPHSVMDHKTMQRHLLGGF